MRPCLTGLARNSSMVASRSGASAAIAMRLDPNARRRQCAQGVGRPVHAPACATG
jgi:hypothetical protein